MKKNIELKQSGSKRRLSKKGKAVLNALGPTLQMRGVPSERYIVVDIDSGAFVTGQSRSEATYRFKSMHPGAHGWLEKVSDVCRVVPAAE